ncbi:MAG: putative acetyl-CoA synthetase (ADP-forming) alpha and beta chain protein [Tardiphaga sp.]|nr:putative acetyl-CoA synthetase (ADP-forming) alpha and beta chain protein [Tardiphaga sp.]
MKMLTRNLDLSGRTDADLLNPSSVAVIGASDNPNKVGGRPIHYMQKFGYSGRILPINPARETVQGLRCYASLDELDEVPEAAIIAVAGEDACEAVRRCARLGVSLAIVMASGFAEIGPAGRQLQDDLVSYARAHGMRLVGPNAQGIANFSSGAVLNFSTMFMEVPPQDGPIAIVSQSGAASVMPYALLRERGFGVRYLAATGNDADLGVSELVRQIASDEDIRLILVYVEAVSNPDMLSEAARIAHQRGAHLVLLKGGSSQRGAAAAASHTGAMVGEDGALDAFLQRHGIWRAHDVHEMINATSLYLGGFPPQQGRTVVMSHSGAVGVLCADAAERAGLPLTNLSEPTLAALKEIIPSFASAANPLDVTASLLGNKTMFPRVLGALGTDPGADMFLIGVPVAGPGYDVPALAHDAARFMNESRRPVVVAAPQASVRSHFEEQGVPTFTSETDAVDALHQYSRQCRSVAPTNSSGTEASHVPHYGLLDEADSLALLAKFGIPVVGHAVCNDADQAAAAAVELGERVVIKGCAAQVPHKSEHGLVRVGVRGAEAVKLAAAECLATLTELNVEGGRVIVARMAKGIHEFMLGAAVDPVFGPLVMIGEGGTLVEMRHDIVSLLAPFTVEEALEAIAKLRIAPVLKGFRGQPALDAKSLAEAATRLGEFAIAYRNTLVSVDMNPVMVMPEGDGVVVVDAVLQFGGKA